MISIPAIIEALENMIVDLKVKVDKNHIHIEGDGENGFEINIYYHPNESMIYFGKSGCHDHYNHKISSFDEFIQMLTFSLIGYSRIIEYSWNNKIRRFNWQDINEDLEWNTTSQLVFPSWKFWKRNTIIEERILQNHFKLRGNI